jgi:hypothetical protein
MSHETKEFGARIPADMAERFKELFPIYGATKWFIQESLRYFLSVVEDNPPLQDVVAASIQSMLSDASELSTDEDQENGLEN